MSSNPSHIFESVVLSGAAWGHANLQGSWGMRSEGPAFPRINRHKRWVPQVSLLRPGRSNHRAHHLETRCRIHGAASSRHGWETNHPRSFASFESVIQSFAPFESVVLSGAAWGHANLQGSWGKRSEGSASCDRDQVPPMVQSHRDRVGDQIIHDLSHHSTVSSLYL